MRQITLTYPRQLFNLWKAGHAHQVWFWQYRDLFDKSDLTNVENQYFRGHHFGEWFTAIYFRGIGYKVLIEKYAFKKHREQFLTATQLVGQAGMAFLASNARTVAQPPDLLVFDPSHRLYFFAEVKRERDRLRTTQRRFFERIEKRLCCQVLIVGLRPDS